MEINVTALTADDEVRLKQQRAMIERHLAPAAIPKYATAAGKLGLLHALLEANLFSPQQTYPLQCMGVVLGDVEEVIVRTELVDKASGQVLFVSNCIGRSTSRVNRGVPKKAEGLAKSIAGWIAALHHGG